MAKALVVYTLAYPMTVIAPLSLARMQLLRRFVVGTWLAAGLGFLAMPARVEFLPAPHAA
jgi:hypothetical protein